MNPIKLLNFFFLIFLVPDLGLAQDFTKSTIDGDFGNPTSVYAADVDGDGDMDVLGAATGANDIAWYENDGSESFTKHTIDGSLNGAYTVYAADVDGDGDMDVLGAGGDSAYGSIVWYENDGSESFTKHTIDGDFDGGRSVYAADVDGDGDMDVLGAAAVDDDIAWYENDGSETFTKRVIDSDFDGYSVSVADVDGDGDMDVLGAAFEDGDIAWYENDGSENFTKRVIDNSFYGAVSVSTADVDGDGDMDVLGSAYLANDIAWYENDGSENFTKRVIDDSFNGVASVYAADVDGDGDKDVLGAAVVDDDIAWYKNDGSGGFIKQPLIDSDFDGYSVYAADVDGDGSMDVLGAAYSDYEIAWFESPFIVVTGVSSTAGNGIYAIDNVISITVTFSANVIVTGTPQLTLETGSSDAVVNYSSGTGTNTLTFDYTVASGHTTSKLDYVATSSLALNSGTINDAVGNAATLTLATPGAANSLGASKSIVVEGIVPTVTGVNSSTADGSYKQGDVVVITVEFSEAVYVTGTPQLTLESGSSDAVVDYRGGGSGSNTLTFNYTVASDHSTSDLDYVATSSLALNSGTINDAVGNAATLTLASPGAANSLGANKAIVVDTTDPTVLNVTSTAANGSYKVGNVIPITVEFSEVVNVIGTPQLRLETGSSDAVSELADYSSGTGTNTLTFDYTVAWDHTTPDLDYVATTSLALSDPNPGYSWYKDTKGNATGVTISGNYAYVANSDAGLAIIDISDSASPGTPVYKDTKGNATGVAISGNYAYVSLNRIEGSLFGSDDNFAGLAIIDISNPTNPGNPVYRDTNGRAKGVAISSNYAYVANGSAGLAIIDISDPTNPGIPVYKDTEGNATGVTISGNYAYVADWTSGLAIIEISNPAVPGTPVYRDTDGYAQGVTINENYVYVADNYAGLAIIDISDPADPGIPVYRDTNGQYSSASCIAISGNYAYVASTNTFSGLAFIDISNPASPGTSGDYITKLSGGTGVAISGNYAYLASGSGLAFVNTNVSDLTDAAGNRATLTLPSPGATGSLAGNKAIIVDNTPPTVINVTSTASDGSYKSGDVIPITLEFSEVVNITGTPQLALETGSSDAIVDYNSGTGTNTLTFNYTVASDHTTSDLDYLATNSLLLPAPNPGTPVYRDTNGEARGVAIRSNYAYIADKDAGLAIIDISDPTNPGTPMYKETNGNAYGVTISSNYAYVANGDAGLAIIDISDPTNPGIPVYKDTEGDATGVAISGNYAYVSTWSAGLAIIDISDPTNPGNPVYRDTDGAARKVALRGNYAYVANGDKPEGFSIIDISNPTIPGNPLFIDALGKGRDVAIKGNYAYVVDGGQWDVANSFTGLAIINISDPTNPGTPVYRDIDGTAYGVTISGKYAYVATQGSGLAIIDISDPTNPGTPVYKDTEGTAWSSTISGKYAYVADGGAGLAIIPTNTGLINNAEGNAATLTLASPGATNSLGANKAIVVDGTEPTMSINANQGIDGFTSEDSILSLTLTSSEAITDFIIGDITVIGGTMSTFVALNDSTYTAIFTASGEGAKTILVAVGTYKDLVGNENIAATQFNWTYDVYYSPQLLDATFTLAENSPNGTVVEIIEASDADGDTLSYTILSGNTDQAFGLNSNTGVLSVTDSTALDYESTPVFSLLVRASDGALSDSAIVTINLTDVEENVAPAMTAATFNLAEDSSNGTVVGTIQASDADGDTLSYTILSGNTYQAFGLNANTGVLSVTDSTALDYESTPVFSLLVRVSDGALSDSAIVTINLTDVEENVAPAITASIFSLAENSVNGTVLGTVEVSDPDGDTLTYTIVSGNDAEAFSLDSESGELTVSTSSALDFETKPTYSLGIEVSDGALSDVAIFTINLTDVEEEEETLSLADASEMIYPNPTDGIINIKMAVFKEATIYNLSGKRIMRSTDNRIDVSSLSEGVYIIKLENRSGDRFSTRLIKE
jgi:hypothetical protein